MRKIVHLTSVHSRYDVRIFLKECSSLVNSYNVCLIVADGLGDELENGVNIYDVGKFKGRLNRIFQSTQKIFNKAIQLDGDIYHLHDPELLPLGIKLQKYGKKVIFDSHEDVEQDILSKEWIPVLCRKFISCVYRWYEKYACQKFDAIITATPYIRDKFLKINQNSIDINNFPLLEEVCHDADLNWEEKENEVCYVGGIAKIRGIKELVKAMEYVGLTQLNLVGSFSEQAVEVEVKNYIGWHNVNALGFLDRKGVITVMQHSKAGIVTFYPLSNHIDAQPNKMFEYMGMGIPVIASNFPLWQKIIEGNHCGICVDPLNAEAIAQAINYIVAHPKEAHQMGQNGLNAVKEIYNWSIEEQKLLKLYGRLELQ